ncbi:MAG: bifunctional demethylmenaquinone methyltransferase/2-methoxy-6-polyprenyl-1,4-benzoquinol methylase UbiE [Bacteroidales bacterium]
MNPEKRASVGAMFDSIAPGYDFLNHFLSFGIDRRWRRTAVSIIAKHHRNPEILDVATGTGDLAISAMKIDPAKVTGIDISEKMLEVGREKIRKKGFSDKIELTEGDSENIPFPDESFDVVMAGFGIRNFSDPSKGLREMKRVLRPGGLVLILEFSVPESFPFRLVYGFYFRRILPLAGRIISKDRMAYSYLPDSVLEFPYGEEFLEMMESAGFLRTGQRKLTGGIATVYTGFKAQTQ